MSKARGGSSPGGGVSPFVEGATGWRSGPIATALVTNLDRLAAVDDAVRDALLTVEQAEGARAAAERSGRQQNVAAAKVKRHQAADAEDAALMAELKTQIQALAPGPASARWDLSVWAGFPAPTCPPAALRIGTVVRARNDPTSPPFLVPLLWSGGLMLVSEPRNPQAQAIVQGLALRALASFPAGRLEIHVYDPEHSGALGALSTLRDDAPELFPPPMTHPAALRECLETFRAGAARVAELLVRTGAPDLATMETRLGQFVEPHRLLVLLSYPTGLDEPTHRELVTLLSSGSRGIMGVVVRPPDARAPYGVDISELDSRLPQFLPANGDRWRPADPAGVAFLPDPPPPAAFASHVAKGIGSAAKSTFVPAIPLNPLLPPPTGRWKPGAAKGELRAVVGKLGMSDLAIELRTKNPPLPNLLVGGAVGQGKSNFLLILLASWLATYSPTELELYLLDLKNGLEFGRLGPRADRAWWVPHVRALGLDGDLAFASAVLKHLVEEYRRRTELLQDLHDYDNFRAARPQELLPRIVLVIDEFQVLFASGDNADDAVTHLETLARLGRACGIHLVLASQSLSGIQALKVKEDAIFGQFPWRIAFKTTASESEALLGQGNRGASTLRFRGEAMVNQDLGKPESNRRAVVAYATDAELDAMFEGFWHASAAVTPPRMPSLVRRDVGASLRLALSRHPLRPTWDPPKAWLGVPVAVTDAPSTFEFRGESGRTLAVVGGGEPEALAILASALYTCGLQASAPDRYIIIDLLDGGASRAPLAGVLRKLQELGHVVSVVARADAGPTLLDLAEELDNLDPARPGRPVWVGLVGAHAAVRWNAQDPQRFVAPRDALQRLLAEGPVLNRFVLGWWASFADYQDQLGFGLVDRVRGRVLLRLAQGDLRTLCGPYETWRQTPWRALYWDPDNHERPLPLVPFAPEPGIP